jgi:UDP-N-acetylglucosamine--N-acetylmuramyl-(pentapeptide) pyrophosphoryl-undecaprenol N-acetylglucosamine transferase
MNSSNSPPFNIPSHDCVHPMSKPLHIVLAAGGTGGHIFPAESLAEQLTALGHQVTMVTDKRFADYSAASMKGILGQIPLHYIHAGTLGRGLAGRALGALRIAQGVAQAFLLLGKIKPDVVVGFGGYPSFPTMLAASVRHIPTIIHEQNAILGKANRMLAPRVQCIATSFPATGMIQAENQHKACLVGNPVRSAVHVLHEMSYPELPQDGMMRILITGGSQGAKIFSEIMPAALALLPESLRLRLRIDQQARAETLEETKERYKSLGVQADLSPFFADVPVRLAASHLVIARSGASTIAELTCAGRPSILIPYPNSADDHQMINARAVEDAGGAWVMPQDSFTAEALAARLEGFLTLPSSLTKSAQHAHAIGRPNAAADLAALVIRHAQQRSTTTSPTTPPAHTSASASSVSSISSSHTDVAA